MEHVSITISSASKNPAIVQSLNNQGVLPGGYMMMLHSIRAHLERRVMLTPSPIQQAGNSFRVKAQWKVWSRVWPSP